MKNYYQKQFNYVKMPEKENIQQLDLMLMVDTTGSMGDEIDNVKNNIIQFAQKIEERGVSARWSAITYSDFTLSAKAKIKKISFFKISLEIIIYISIKKSSSCHFYI